jgi:hypothetical protein
VYVQPGDRSAWRKLELPLWSQLSASLVFGLLATGILFFVTARIARRFRQRA